MAFSGQTVRTCQSKTGVKVLARFRVHKLILLMPLLVLVGVSFPPRLVAASPASALDDPAVMFTALVGNGVRGPAVDPDTGRIYVANWLDGDVSVIAPDGGVITRIPTLLPEAIGIDPPTNRVLVVDTTGDITVIDRRTNQVSQRVDLSDGGPRPMSASIIVDVEARRILSALRPDPKKAVLLDADALESLTTFPSLEDVLPMGFDAELHRAYIPDSVSSKVLVVDTQSGDIVGSEDLTPAQPVSAAVDDVLHRVYAIANGSQVGQLPLGPTLYVIDGQTHQVLQTIAVPDPSPHVSFSAIADPVRGRLYYATDDELLTIDTATNAILAHRTLIPGLSGLAIDSSKNRLYVTADPDLDHYAKDSVLMALDTNQLDSTPSALPGTGGAPASLGRDYWPALVGIALILVAALVIRASLVARRP